MSQRAQLVLQETQLSLTNRAIDFDPEGPHHRTIPYVGYVFLLVCCINFVRKKHIFLHIPLQNAARLKTGIESVKVVEKFTVMSNACDFSLWYQSNHAQPYLIPLISFEINKMYPWP